MAHRFAGRLVDDILRENKGSDGSIHDASLISELLEKHAN
jgi:hypothetical protein